MHYPIDHGIIIHGSLVKRLRRRPLTAETRVRFPYGLLKQKLSVHSAEGFLFLQAINNYKTIENKKLMPACKHDASAFLFLRWIKSLCLKYNNTCALQIIAQIVYSAGIDADNSWSENVVLTVFYNSCLFTIAKLYN